MKYSFKTLFDPHFLRQTFSIALPVAIQQLVASSVNMIDVVMIGSLGDGAVAAAGAANQIFFLLNLALFGITSGATVFLSQFWGTRDRVNVHRTGSLMLIIGTIATAVFTLGALLIPQYLVQLYVHEAYVIDLAADYLFIVGFSYPFTAISMIFSTVCRCTGNVRLPTVTSVVSVITNAVGNAILIFGLLGFPALGLRGAAIATVVARGLEAGLLLLTIYRNRLPSAIPLRGIFGLERGFIKTYVFTTLPVLCNEILWSVGNSLYNVAYGQLGTSAVAAVQITSTVMQLFFVLQRGIGSACSIMIGQRIGAEDRDGAILDSRRFALLMPAAGLFICFMIYFTTPLILSMYSVTEEALLFAHQLLMLNAVLFTIRPVGNGIVVGILRSGGDTLYAAIVDVGAVWLFGVPLAFLGVKLGFPLWAVFLCVASEDIVKLIVAIPRLLSNKWIKNVTSQLQKGPNSPSES